MNTPEEKLTSYAARRNFNLSPEPFAAGPARGQSKTLRYVVQKHDASRLHYDFRLEVEGVLVSWALPKGPPVESDERRLAVKVEDHPLDYRDFEGTIPEGEYGGGTVMLWDKGTYENLRANKKKQPMDMMGSLRDGLVEVHLNGDKLKGSFALKRFKEERGKEQWLMLMMKKGGVPQPGLLECRDESVKTGRSMRAIREEGDA